jgi:hypothetical protein
MDLFCTQSLGIRIKFFWEVDLDLRKIYVDSKHCFVS